MVRLKLEFAVLFSSIVRDVPIDVPRRISIIQERFHENTKYLTIEQCSKMTDIEIDIGLEFNNKFFFIENTKMLTELDKLCCRNDKFLLNSYGKILLPKVKRCHDEQVSLSIGNGRQASDGVTCLIYSMEGIYSSKFFTGKCKNKRCKKQFTPFYEEDIIDNVILRKYYKPDGKYFGTTRESVFEIKLLEHITDLVFLCSAEFVNISETLNNQLFKGENQMSRNILENNFFMYHIAQILPMFPMTVRRYESNRMINVEHFCSQAYPLIKRLASDNYVRHVCNEDKGCGLRIAVIDGNEKAKRKLCKAPKEHIQENIGRLNYYKLCVNNPDRGKQSAYCEDHSYLNNKKENNANMSTGVQLDLRPRTRLFVKQLQEKKIMDDNLLENCDFGCRQEQNVKKEYEKTAGVVSIVRTCGIRLGTYELYTQESPSQLVLALIDKFGEYPKDDELKVVCVDIACAVHPFLVNRAKDNIVLARYANLEFVLDTFHADKHRMPQCMVGVEGKYNPRLDKFKYLRGSNLEAAETSFVILNKFKNSCNYMTAAKRMTFFTLLEDALNYRKEKQQESKGNLLQAGYKRGNVKNNLMTNNL